MKSSEVTIEERVIVFIDIHHYSLAFDGLMEGYQFLQEMYEKLGGLIVGHGGEIVKYLGDSILSTFPAGREVQAIECGMEMRQAFAIMVEQNGLPAEIELEVGIGSGKVVVGMCGHRTHRLMDIFGDVVNQTAMIGHYQGVAVTEKVYERVREKYTTRRMPDLETRRPGRLLKAWAIVE